MVFLAGPNIQEIERMGKYADVENLRRTKGGIISGMIKVGSETYQKTRHFILPIKNAQGDARFMYKSNMGHFIYQNKKHA